MASAFRRLTLSELGAESSLPQAEFIGLFEYFYSDNVAGFEFGKHYVVLGYRLSVDETTFSLPTEQHNGYRWFTVD